LIDRFAGWVLGAWLLCSSAGLAELLVLESEEGIVLVSTQEVKEEGGKILFTEPDFGKKGKSLAAYFDKTDLADGQTL
jgi:hypothetical protein